MMSLSIMFWTRTEETMNKYFTLKEINLVPKEKNKISSFGCCKIAYLIWKEAKTSPMGFHEGLGYDNKKVTKELTKNIKNGILKEWTRVEKLIQKHYAKKSKKNIYRILSLDDRYFFQDFIDNIVYKDAIREIDTPPEAEEGDHPAITCFERLNNMVSNYSTGDDGSLVENITWYINKSIIPYLYIAILRNAIRRLNDIEYYNNNCRSIHELHVYSLKVACQNLYRQCLQTQYKRLVNPEYNQIDKEHRYKKYKGEIKC